MRKLVATIVLLGLIFLGSRFFGVIGGGPVPVEIHYLLGTPPVAAGLDVELRRVPAEPPVARFETQLVGPDVVQTTRLPAGAIDLDITLISAAGARRTVLRSIEAERGAVIRLDLSREAMSWR